MIFGNRDKLLDSLNACISLHVHRCLQRDGILELVGRLTVEKNSESEREAVKYNANLVILAVCAEWYSPEVHNVYSLMVNV